ncbi:MAG TPA: sigma-70 family RNA polymerase sigma factor [Aggregatilineales bacterium]|nr:sigma-70 family RNA polymerase sigma factor [Anaerolineales bacterium]HRE47679.1 sigma-70 family RNA polymerase sigma factor [Aggregatilineales bacterium]
MDDLRLIEGIKGRDEEAMMSLYQRYTDLVYSVAFRIVNDAPLAEECVQDVFLKVWQNIAQFDSTRGAFPPWLVGITRNLAIDCLRGRARRENTAPLDEERGGENTLAEAFDVDLRRDQAASLRAAIESLLSPEQRQVIDLAYFGGMTHTDISEHLGVPLGTVKTRIRLAMQKLREAWLRDKDE